MLFQTRFGGKKNYRSNICISIGLGSQSGSFYITYIQVGGWGFVFILPSIISKPKIRGAGEPNVFSRGIQIVINEPLI